MSDIVTIADSGYAEYIEKKSKFLAYAKHVHDESEAADFIASVRSRHWDARHNVYAYVIGGNAPLQRSTDDGEPAGTAGRPVLEMILGEGLTDVAVVVSRYFGGVLLGTGGLIRAYGKAAKDALLDAGRVRAVAMKIVCIHVDYDLAGKMEHYLIGAAVTIDDIIYGSNVSFFCLLPAEEVTGFQLRLTEHFHRELSFEVSDEERVAYVAVE